MIDFPAIQAAIDVILSQPPDGTAYRDRITPADYGALERYKAVIFADITGSDAVSSGISCAEHDVIVTVGVQSSKISDNNDVSYAVGVMLEDAGYHLSSTEFERDVDSDAPFFERRLIYILRGN